MTTVLIVDDELGLADITADLLREAGYELVIAINGKAGLASLATCRPDLVIVDLMMPVMDGPEMIRRMKGDPALASIPVILMTAFPEALYERGLEDAVLVKPFSLSELRQIMERLLQRA